MNDDPFGARLDKLTEGMSVNLPELRDAPIGYRLTVMMGTEPYVFEVTGHAKDETQLMRVRNTKGR